VLCCIHHDEADSGGLSMNIATRTREDVTPLPLLWGAEAIGAHLNIGKRKVELLLPKGVIKSAYKVGHFWVANANDLDAEFTVNRGQAAAAE
jgi:hypothetical protein